MVSPICAAYSFTSSERPSLRRESIPDTVGSSSLWYSSDTRERTSMSIRLALR